MTEASKPDVLLVIGQGHILLDAFGERTEEVYTSKEDLYTSLRGFREVLESEEDFHLDIIYDTAHAIGGIRSFHIKNELQIECIIVSLYNVVNNAYDQLMM